MKDFGTVFIYSIAVFFAAKFLWKWATGGFNNDAVMEWINRGFSFGIGLSVAFLVVTLIIKLVSSGW